MEVGTPRLSPSDLKESEAMKDFERAEKILMDSGYFAGDPGSPGGLCPVQHTALLKDGRTYYFRSRGSVASIEIFPEWAEWKEEGGLPDEQPEGEYETSYRWPDAGYISPVKAARLIVKWLSFFYSDPFRRYDQRLRAMRLKENQDKNAQRSDSKVAGCDLSSKEEQ
jgi:hypothetical protein